MEINGINTTGRLYCFLPEPLNIVGKPEYLVFPFNVFVSRHQIKDIDAVKGLVFWVYYEPDLSSFNHDSAEELSMNYYNRYNHDYYLKIMVNTDNKERVCAKYFKDKCLEKTISDNDWNSFFTRVAVLGLAKNETCMCQEVGDNA
jgi:hypothetical protein